MKYQIICNGDSWTFGCELTDPEVDRKYGGPVKVYRGEYDYFEENIPYRTARIWPTYLRRYLDCQTVNLSWPADDNTTIYNRTIDYVTREYLSKGRSTENLVVIVGWTSPERNSFWWEDDEWNWIFRLWPHISHFDRPKQKEFWKLYVSHMWTPSEFIPRYINNNLNLQNFCIANGIKYMMYDSFYQVADTHVREWDKSLEDLFQEMVNYSYAVDSPDTFDRKSYIHDWKLVWNQIKSPNFYRKNEPGNTFNEFIKSKLSNPYIGLHPSPEAHDIWAQEIARYLKEHIL